MKSGADMTTKAETTKAEDRLASILQECQSYRVVDAFDSPPGKRAPNGSWCGEICWARKMPDGTVLAYTADLLYCIFNIKAENYGETLFLAEKCGIDTGDKNIWRIYSSAEKKYLWGRILERPASAGIFFKEEPGLWQKSTLANEFSGENRKTLRLKVFDNEEIRKMAQKSTTFAENLYQTLTNNEFYNMDTGLFESLSFRAAARLVAAIREAGEDYMDFYCIGGEGTKSPKIEKMLKQIGITKDQPEEKHTPAGFVP